MDDVVDRVDEVRSRRRGGLSERDPDADSLKFARIIGVGSLNRVEGLVEDESIFVNPPRSLAS